MMDLEKNTNQNNTNFKFSYKIIISLTTTLFVTILGIVSYGLGYSFLYGYLLGGGVDNDLFSSINLFLSPVPFNFYTVTIMGVFIALTVICLYLMYRLIRKKKRKLMSIIFVIFGLTIFHFVIVQFFISNVDSEIFFINYIYSLIIWIVPFFILIIIENMILFQYRSIEGLSGIFTGILLIIAALLLFDEHVVNSYIATLAPFICSFCSFLFMNLAEKFRLYKKFYKKFYKTFYITPYVFTLVLALLKLITYVKTINLESWSLIFIFIFISSIIISYFISRKVTWNIYIENITQITLKEQCIHFIKQILPKYLNNQGLIMIMVFVLLIAISLPMQVNSVGKQFRILTEEIKECKKQPPLPYQETIVYNDNKEFGYVFNDKNSVYYIVDRNWELMRIKSSEVSTYSTKQSKINLLCDG